MIKEKKRRNRPKQKSIRPAVLFAKTALKASYLNKEIVEEVYNELVRVVMEELREKGEVILPNLGRFKIVKTKERMCHDYQQHKMVLLPPRFTARFRVDYKIRRYFKAYDGDFDNMKNNIKVKKV